MNAHLDYVGSMRVDCPQCGRHASIRTLKLNSETPREWYCGWQDCLFSTTTPMPLLEDPAGSVAIDIADHRDADGNSVKWVLWRNSAGELLRSVETYARSSAELEREAAS